MRVEKMPSSVLSGRRGVEGSGRTSREDAGCR